MTTTLTSSVSTIGTTADCGTCS